MLSPLKPPTDNLYKFIAIAGLVCFVVGVVLWVRQVQKTLDIAFLSEEALHEAWLTLGDGFQDGDDETAFQMINNAVEKAMDGKDPFGLTQEARKLGTLSNDQIAAVRRFEIAVESFADQRQSQRFVERWLVVVVMFGLVATVGGFILWYERTQKYHDQLLRIQTGEQLPVEQRDEPANAGRRWTEDEEAKLQKGFEAGKTFKQLAKDHGRTAGAIKARLIKLGLIEDPRIATSMNV